MRISWLAGKMWASQEALCYKEMQSNRDIAPLFVHCSLWQYVEQWRTQELCSRGRRSSTNSVEDRRQRERGSGGSSPPTRGSGGSCNLVQEISFLTV